MKSGVSPQKLQKYGRQTRIWEFQASICIPITPSLLISSGHSPRLGGTIFVWGAQAVIWGARPRNAPPVALGLGGKPQITCNDVIRNSQKRNFL